MSTRYDILTEKAKYTEHCGTHQCKAGKCDVRAALFIRWMKSAAKWGIEPGDNERQRRQYATMHAA
jgi:hypothetical protein